MSLKAPWFTLFSSQRPVLMPDGRSPQQPGEEITERPAGGCVCLLASSSLWPSDKGWQLVDFRVLLGEDTAERSSGELCYGIVFRLLPRDAVRGPPGRAGTMRGEELVLCPGPQSCTGSPSLTSNHGEAEGRSPLSSQPRLQFNFTFSHVPFRKRGK